MFVTSSPLVRRACVMATALWVWLCASRDALAMSKCPPGTGGDPWLLILSVALTIPCVGVFVVFLLNRPDGHPRQRARRALVAIALFSSCGSCTTMTWAILDCSPIAQEPEVLCEHFATLASESKEPVAFDHAACMAAWRKERETLPSRSYRELSSCARGMSLAKMTSSCREEGFAFERHAPGNWPPPPSKSK